MAVSVPRPAPPAQSSHQRAAVRVAVLPQAHLTRLDAHLPGPLAPAKARHLVAARCDGNGASSSSTLDVVHSTQGGIVPSERWSNIIGDDSILEVPTLRHLLQPRDSPFCPTNNFGGGFVGDRDLCLLNAVKYESEESAGAQCQFGIYNTKEGTCQPLPPWAIRSGPRGTTYWDPKKVTAGVVTCGGLCPGLNDVVQNIVYTLCDYGVPADQIYGIRYGLRGFYDRNFKPINLNRNIVDGIHLQGGTMLGTSRGGADIREIVRRIDLWGINQLYVVGGNGGNAAAHAIQTECERSGVLCAVIGVPKSIDNDILLVDKCFGYETAVEEAQRALLAAKVEAHSACYGIGLVKLMGRSSGFIAMQASMSSGVVDVCLIPEVPFELDCLMDFVAQVVDHKGHCVICIAEGAAQELMDGQPSGFDASGNPILKDVGSFLKNELKKAFPNADVKYIDPTYMIRAIPSSTTDRVYCKVLGQGAVHGAFAGYTGFTVGLINTHYVFLPIPVIVQSARTVDPRGRQWNRLKTAINQPDLVHSQPASQNGNGQAAAAASSSGSAKAAAAPSGPPGAPA